MVERKRERKRRRERSGKAEKENEGGKRMGGREQAARDRGGGWWRWCEGFPLNKCDRSSRLVAKLYDVQTGPAAPSARNASPMRTWIVSGASVIIGRCVAACLWIPVMDKLPREPRGFQKLLRGDIRSRRERLLFVCENLHAQLCVFIVSSFCHFLS